MSPNVLAWGLAPPSDYLDTLALPWHPMCDPAWPLAA